MENSKDLRVQSTTINMIDVLGTTRLAVVLKQHIGRVKFVKCKFIVTYNGKMTSYEEGNFDADEKHLIAWCARWLWDTMRLSPQSLRDYLHEAVIVFYCTERSKTLKDGGGCCVIFDRAFK